MVFLINVKEYPDRAAIVILLYGVLNILIFYFQYIVINPLLISGARYWRAAAYMVIVLAVSITVKYGIAIYYADIILQYRYSGQRYIYNVIRKRGQKSDLSSYPCFV